MLAGGNLRVLTLQLGKASLGHILCVWRLGKPRIDLAWLYNVLEGAFRISVPRRIGQESQV